MDQEDLYAQTQDATDTEEVLFVDDAGCPVRLVTYLPSGRQDVQVQTGPAHDRALARARELMRERGCGLRDTGSVGMFGWYYAVEPLQEAST